jgi:uncharacterized protein DUF4838
MKQFLILPFAFLFCVKGISQSRLETIPVFANASNDSVNAAIQVLLHELNKAGNYQFKINPERLFNQAGILFLIATDQVPSKIILPSVFKQYGTEGIYIKSDKSSIIIAGNSALALQEAVFMYLEHLGFRYFMPGEEWHIIPQVMSIYKPVLILTKPFYESRVIANAHAYANSKKIENDFTFWAKANRLGGGFEVSLGHAYDYIVLSNAEIFKQHPEYFAGKVEKGTLPPNPKFNVANQELVQLILNDALKRMETQIKQGYKNMITMEPSDGGGFCTTPECRTIGSSADQVFYLSNMVAKLFQKKYPGVWVSSYAYNEHIFPPRFPLEQNLFVMITNGFNPTRYSTNELLQIWKKRVSKVGVYEYLSVYEWDFDLPGQVRTSKIPYLKKSVRDFYDNGARAYNGESVMGWVNKGPGQYILARLLWNFNVNTDSLKNDFYTKAFGSVAPLIRKLYEQFETYPHRRIPENDLANWLKIVNEAYKATNDSSVRKRIEHIKGYLHYLVLYNNLKDNPVEKNMIQLLEYAYKYYGGPMSQAFATLPLLVSLPSIMNFPKLGWYGEESSKWKQNNSSVDSRYINTIFAEDVRTIKRTAELKSFSLASEFRKINSEEIGNINFEETPHTYWGRTDFLIRINKKSDSNYLRIISSLSATLVNRDVKISVFPLTNTGKGQDTLLKFSQNKVHVFETISLKSLLPGYYVININDYKNLFRTDFSKSIDYSIILKPDELIQTTTVYGYNVFYFYVPKNVINFRVYIAGVIQLQSPRNRVLNYENNKDEIIEVKVEKGEEGIWKIFKQSGTIFLEGIPPYFGVHPKQMLIPVYKN